MTEHGTTAVGEPEAEALVEKELGKQDPEVRVSILSGALVNVVYMEGKDALGNPVWQFPAHILSKPSPDGRGISIGFQQLALFSPDQILNAVPESQLVTTYVPAEEFSQNYLGWVMGVKAQMAGIVLPSGGDVPPKKSIQEIEAQLRSGMGG